VTGVGQAVTEGELAVVGPERLPQTTGDDHRKLRLAGALSAVVVVESYNVVEVGR
jgi:hypothetical protein